MWYGRECVQDPNVCAEELSERGYLVLGEDDAAMALYEIHRASREQRLAEWQDILVYELMALQDGTSLVQAAIQDADPELVTELVGEIADVMKRKTTPGSWRDMLACLAAATAVLTFLVQMFVEAAARSG